MARAYPQLRPLCLIDIAPELIQQRQEEAQARKEGVEERESFMVADCRYDASGFILHFLVLYWRCCVSFDIPFC
jgi:hypothetical protein